MTGRRGVDLPAGAQVLIRLLVPCNSPGGLEPEFEGLCVQAPFMGTSLRSDPGMIAKQDEQSERFLAGASSLLSVSMTNIRAAVGRATIVCPVMSWTTNGHVNERDYP